METQQSFCLLLQEPSLYTVKAVFILDNDGNRLLSKYYDPELYPSMKEQKNFEKNVFNKTHKADSKFLCVFSILVSAGCDPPCVLYPSPTHVSNVIRYTFTVYWYVIPA
uniref:Coatomer subunit zeta n=1 Tax=Sparus aurata TaxID=8175 RepID=A0A671TYE9_SPAAU